MESNPVIQLFLAISIIIAAAKIAGSVAQRLGQPRVFGELLAGVILGPSLLNFLHWPVFTAMNLEETVHQLAELGVLLLMFMVGLEVDLCELVKVGHVAALGGGLGAVAPVALTMPVILAFGFPMEAALFAGVALAATSVSVSAQTLLELGILRTKEGSTLLAAAVIDDVLAILLVSLAIAVTGPQATASPGEMAIIVVRIAAYLVGALAVAWFVLPRLINWIHDHGHIAQGAAAFGLIFALMFGWSADALGGMAAITGAFIAGVGLGRARESVKHEIEMAVRNIAYPFLVPVFFVGVGLLTDLRQLDLSALPLAGLLLLAAVASKVGGCGVGVRLGGFDNLASFRVGVCMISRGEVGLIIAAIGLAHGVFDEVLFSSLFVVILLTTILTPPLMRWVFEQRSVPGVKSALVAEPVRVESHLSAEMDF